MRIIKKGATLLFLIGIGLSFYLLLNRPTEKNSRYQLPPTLQKQPTTEINFATDERKKEEFLIGGLAIPKLNKTLKIYDQAEEPYITKGVGMDVTDRKMGIDNVVLASHDYNQTFGGLVHLVIGDVVYTTDEKNIYTYEVTEHYVAIDDDVRDIKKVRENQKEPMLTLYTCLGGQGTSERTVVQGKLKEVTSIDASDESIQQLFLSTS